MAWFRTNRGVAAWLAFFALACQLTFSFGHVHVGKFVGGWAAQLSAQTTDAASGAPPSPPQKNPARHADDFCAICANISLAGTLILPIPAVLLAPVSFIQVLPWSPTAGEPAAPDHSPFSARGPPYA